ncbi:phage antirepressor KilAC domain-containing protein [Chryseobacterium sp. 7]|uniref:phage antirepressor KilAC domain-containing protein n=1 Tax=Chryseobacterium sp. 7 TaxID=2035214 RepID=UPI003977CD90
MTELVFKNDGNIVTNSLLVADRFEKEHKNVLRDIENLVAQNSAAKSFFQESYYENRGKQYPMFIMNRDGFSLLVMGFTGKKALDFKLEYIEAFNKMEKSLLQQSQYHVPGSFAEALKLAYQQAEQIELQSNELKKQAPKVQYFDNVLQSESTYNTNQIAKELGMSAVTLNRMLCDMHVQYKQNGTWLLYSKHQNKGYTKTKTHSYTDTSGSTKTSMQTVWTEKGRLFIHDIIKDNEKIA